MLRVGVTTKQIENKHLQNLLIFRVWIIWQKKIGGTAPNFGENNLPSTPFKICTEFNKKCAYTK